MGFNIVKKCADKKIRPSLYPYSIVQASGRITDKLQIEEQKKKYQLLDNRAYCCHQKRAPGASRDV
jgi:hypothetical protein